jgi:hypothetical protein
MGKGFVNEPDNWGTHNPPTNPKLLNKLTKDFVQSNFNTKLLLKRILNSSEFQSAQQYESHRLLAEVLVDALSDITGIWDSYRSRVPEPFTFYPVGTRSVELGDATVSSSILDLFGRTSRDVSLENQHATDINDRQVLYLLNSTNLEQTIRKSPRIKQLVDNTKTVTELIHELSCLTLGRFATETELKLLNSYYDKNKLNRKDFATDLVWMYINSTEFLYQH